MTSFTSSPRTDRDALLVLNAIPGLGNRRVLELIAHLGSPQGVLAAFSDGTLRDLGLAESLLFNLEHFDVAGFLQKEHALLQKQGARLITIVDDEYPPRLKEIADAPIVLYIAGQMPASIECAVAVVGARRASLYGIQMAEKFSRELAEMGVPIVSGLARGIDAAAHRGCLKAGGETVAVLGCGLDVIYPQENRALFEEIRQTGCVMSEFPLGTPPLPYNFPRRNRIVSGLSLGVVVVEARLKSGALITADFALEQGREVFALPGRVDSPLSEGPHAILRQGAKLVLSVEDILEELPLKKVRPQRCEEEEASGVTDLDGDEGLIMALLKEDPLPLEDLEAKTGLSSSMLMSPLLSLQIKKIIRELPGKVYQLVCRK